MAVSQFDRNGERVTAEAYVLAVPFERVAALVPDLPIDLSRFTHSPITGIHLWFDRAITELPHATLLDRTIQWMFNKHEGRTFSWWSAPPAAWSKCNREEVIDLALRRVKGIFSASCGSAARACSRRERSSRHVLGGTGSGRASPGQRNLYLRTCFWPAIGRVPAGQPRWKARCAAVI